MKYSYEFIRECGDASSDYNIRGEFPVKFSKFFKEIIQSTNDFKIDFKATNDKFGGWVKNNIKVEKEKRTGKIFWKQIPEGIYDQLKDLEVESCWANRGWGQMMCFVRFKGCDEQCD